MATDPTSKTTPDMFLEQEAGRYHYNRVFTFISWCFFGVAMLTPLATVHVFADPSSSDMQNIKALIALLLSPILALTTYSLARNFKEIRIDRAGIKVLPYGLHIASEHIDDIRYGKNFAGVRTIEIKVNKPYRVFQMALWSLGRKVTLGFNPKLFSSAHGEVN
ncbi:hypothetical protein [uncultured Tateyamaria sp.]|uniref:hypothetical protein n=1 Tax=uncultured Tateyamaria sp. TaxID=455651 RepID=UPI0026300AB6|nr:hypothetical protein [uncultured Tateyamaria sp.]